MAKLPAGSPAGRWVSLFPMGTARGHLAASPAAAAVLLSPGFLMPTGRASALQTQEVTLRPLSWPALQALSVLRPVPARGDVCDSGGLLAPGCARRPTLHPALPPRAALLPTGPGRLPRLPAGAPCADPRPRRPLPLSLPGVSSPRSIARDGQGPQDRTQAHWEDPAPDRRGTKHTEGRMAQGDVGRQGVSSQSPSPWSTQDTLPPCHLVRTRENCRHSAQGHWGWSGAPPAWESVWLGPHFTQFRGRDWGPSGVAGPSCQPS